MNSTTANYNAPHADARIAGKPLLAALAGSTVHPPPVWLMRQAGRYLPEYRELRAAAGSFLGLCLNPEHAAEVTMQPLRRYGFDAAILFADILLVPMALGQPLDYIEGEGPRLEVWPTTELVSRLDREHVTRRLGPVFETVARIAAGVPDHVAVIGFAGAPWTVATYMVGGGKGKDAALDWVRAAPDEYEQLSEVLVTATVEYLSRQVEAGAEALQLFDSWAGLMPTELFDRFIIQPTRSIVAALKSRRPATPIIGYPRGADQANYEAYARATGVDAIGLDETCDLAWGATLQTHLPVQGNFDPQLLESADSDIEGEVHRVCGALQNGAHIFNLGHGIRPAALPDNVARLVAAVHNFQPE